MKLIQNDEHPLPDTLPLSEAGLAASLDTLGLGPGDGVPCWGPDGEWVGLAGIRAEGLFDWTPGGDPGVYGLTDFDENEAREELRRGRVHIALLYTELGEMQDRGGNFYMTVRDARTVLGTCPVFYFDHEGRYITPYANSVVELYARKILDHWGDLRGRREAVLRLLHTPVTLDPAWLEAAQALIDHKLWEDGED